MARKKTGFGSTPGVKKTPADLDAFVNGASATDEPVVDEQTDEVGVDTSSTRLSIDVQRWIRDELKIASIRKGVTMTDYVRELIYESLDVTPVDTDSEGQ